MYIQKLNTILTEIEDSLWNINNKHEDKVNLIPDTLDIDVTRNLIQEAKEFFNDIIEQDNDDRKERIDVDLQDYPLLQGIFVMIGPHNVMKWLKEEISKEIKHKRDTASKRQDNENTNDIFHAVKDKKSWQQLDINPPHGSRVNWEKGEDKAGQ